MVYPSVASWMKQGLDFAGDWIDAGYVRSFVEIAAVTG
jgi:hypothetical protein